MKREEDAIQRAVVTYLRTVLVNCQVFAVPNGGARRRIEAAILKSTGTMAGVPDLIISRPLGHVAYLEIKAGKGKLSEAQAGFRDWCHANGTPWGLIRSIDDARDFLALHNIPNVEVTK
jgi:hypothetical protein